MPRTATRCATAPPPQKPQSSPSEAVSLALLNLVTLLWGTQHAVIKLAVDSDGTTPATLNFARFLLAALLFAPALPPLPALPPRSKLATAKLPAVWACGLEQSLWMFLGYAFQSVGLLTTSAARSGFLLYLNVKFVPILARVLYGRHIQPAVWASAGLALAGTALLSYDGSPPHAGDLWSVAAALASAMFILRLENAARSDAAPAALNAVSLAGVAALSGLWAAATCWRLGPDMPDHAGALLASLASGMLPNTLQGFAAVVYLGVVTTALSNFIQTIGQRRVGAERAAVIFAMDPVYGAGFAYLLLGERLGLQGFLGAAIITAAAILSNQATPASNDLNVEGDSEDLEGVGDTDWLEHSLKHSEKIDRNLFVEEVKSSENKRPST